ncbi:N-acetyltransferase [Arthrobacter sp. zg-Y238]|uniref:GNAT family N-acetyltransferase n=1 Tax=Arthrobacter sp. zg-Y238 TaxID=2964614 RepID=UPI002105E8A6|nr:GNAT family N-acetyltransferase [Arthrobacter sp. zg-Y238]MCQ1954482.1 GNAT family N-acetyltransferase [Arthrobacter sp. zg-Y238]
MTIELRVMPAERFAAWLEESRRGYEQSRIESGESTEVAAQKARAGFAASFPDGQIAPGQLVYDVVALDGNGASTVVGYLWISQTGDRADAWWVSDIEIHEDHRGKGYGRAAMQLAEGAAAKQGAATLGLNVFGYNTVAHDLYESLGYETVSTQMRKPVGQ